MCEKCDREREFLQSMQAIASHIEDDPIATRDLMVAITLEERDQDVARHLMFLRRDSSHPVEELLLGAIYLDVLDMKARIQ